VTTTTWTPIDGWTATAHCATDDPRLPALQTEILNALANAGPWRGLHDISCNWDGVHFSVERV